MIAREVTYASCEPAGNRCNAGRDWLVHKTLQGSRDVQRPQPAQGPKPRLPSCRKLPANPSGCGQCGPSSDEAEEPEKKTVYTNEEEGRKWRNSRNLTRKPKFTLPSSNQVETSQSEPFQPGRKPCVPTFLLSFGRTLAERL